MTASRLAPLVALVALAGCDTLGSGETRFPGSLVQNALGVETISAPDTVVAGRPFDVTVVTSGGGCIRQGDVTVETVAARADVRPFNVFRDPGRNGGCTMDFILFEHRASVTFAAPGVATVRAVGSGGERGSGPPPAGAPLVTVERTVVVVPATF